MKAQTITICLLLALTSTIAEAGGQISLANYTSAHDASCWYQHANTIQTIELGLVNAINPSFGSSGERAVTNVSGFECKLIPHEGVTILAVNFPVPAIDVGRNGGMVVGFSEPIPVVPGGKTILATVDVFFGGDTSFPLLDQPTSLCYMGYNTWIQVTETFPASIEGSVAFIDADDPDDPLVAAFYNPDHDLRIYLLKDPSVATEINTWGQVKAIYR